MPGLDHICDTPGCENKGQKNGKSDSRTSLCYPCKIGKIPENRDLRRSELARMGSSEIEFNYDGIYKGMNAVQVNSMRVALRKAGFTEEMFVTLNYAQGGLCYICNKSNYEQGLNRRLCADHSHLNQTPRGLLCHKCNLTLGQMNDDPELLLQAVRYLLLFQ